MQVLVVLFLALWFSLVTLIGGLVFAAALFDVSKGDRGSALAIPPFLILAGVAIVALGRFAARKQGKYLIDFVRYMLDADDVEEGRSR